LNSWGLLRSGWFRFQGESGLGEEAWDQVGSVLDAFQPGADDRGEVVDAVDGEVAQAGFQG
jgi:hypothetical protein